MTIPKLTLLPQLAQFYAENRVVFESAFLNPNKPVSKRKIQDIVSLLVPKQGVIDCFIGYPQLLIERCSFNTLSRCGQENKECFIGLINTHTLGEGGVSPASYENKVENKLLRWMLDECSDDELLDSYIKQYYNKQTCIILNKYE